MTVLHNKMTFLYNKMTVLHNKITVLHNKMTVLHNEMTVLHNKMTVLHNKMKIGYRLACSHLFFTACSHCRPTDMWKYRLTVITLIELSLVHAGLHCLRIKLDGDDISVCPATFFTNFIFISSFKKRDSIQMFNSYFNMRDFLPFSSSVLLLGILNWGGGRLCTNVWGRVNLREAQIYIKKQKRKKITLTSFNWGIFPP